MHVTLLPKNFHVTHCTSLQNKITSHISRKFTPHFTLSNYPGYMGVCSDLCTSHIARYHKIQIRFINRYDGFIQDFLARRIAVWTVLEANRADWVLCEQCDSDVYRARLKTITGIYLFLKTIGLFFVHRSKGIAFRLTCLKKKSLFHTRKYCRTSHSIFT